MKLGSMGTALAVVVAALALAPITAQAQETQAAQPGAEDARTLFQRGQTAYSQGDYDGAITQWARAYELDPRPLLQFNLSQAYERLGRLEDAIGALEQYLENADPNDEHQADARARLSSVRERLGRTSVRIVGGPEGATILIDGNDVGRTPRPDPIQVAPGSHRVIVRASGYADFTSSVVVSAGQAVEVPVEMAPAAAAVASGGELPIVPIVLFSVGGAALIAGAVMGGIALSDAQSAPGRTSP
ncbi:MAG: PEGA domain-containing protein, partial [Myxococcota bacterium]|nr:PEGA domain-containing protein [Myxococcota bacterium]